MHGSTRPQLENYEIVAEAGRGGMGTVYKARNRQTNRIVALKVLLDPAGEGADRFQSEVRILSTLSHPHIVRAEDHGYTLEGDPYLVMEWLEGETLEKKLVHGALSVDEMAALAACAASALGFAHEHGILHRDVKPSNLFLVGGNPNHCKILDFGIARFGQATRHLTRTGSILGTPGYMAPEQARGETTLGPQVDVFALGCVLFECLAGQPAFQGMHAMALLAKLLLDDPPRLAEVCPQVPRGYTWLIEQMMHKSPSERPRDGYAVADALRFYENTEKVSSGLARTPDSRAVISTQERRLLSIIVIAPLSSSSAGLPPTEATLPAADEATWKLLEGVRKAVQGLDAKADILADGTILVVLSSNGDHPTNQVARAVRSSLWIRDIASRLAMAIVTGRGGQTDRSPLGGLVERAAEMLGHAPPTAERPLFGVIFLDEATHALLDPRFEVVEQQKGPLLLRRERPVGEVPRTLLGKPTPFVGRDRELRRIIEMVEDSFEEQMPTAIVVEAEAGMGKSRLRQELLAQLREKFEGVIIAVGRGDPLSGSSAYATFRSLFRSVLHLAEDDPIEKQRDIVSVLVSRYVAPPEQQRIIEFMGEMIGVPFPDDDSPKLRAARRSPQILADQIQMAYLEFSRARAALRPAVLVFEDLQWCDAASIGIVDVVLRELKAQYVVIGFARPEIHERFPKLWASRQVHSIRLAPLPRRAAEQLARSVLGTAVEAERIAAILDRASGNAFFLEELIRAVAQGYEDALPETVLGVLETRLSKLPDEARQCLRAASIFGEGFFENGVRALIGGRMPARPIELTLTLLVEQEIIVARQERRFAQEQEYAFRHGLVYETAYATLTERDREMGHRLAGEWLEHIGEQDSHTLATHFDKGGDRDRAVVYYAGAAEQALRGNDYTSALKLAQRGIELCTAPLLLADLHATAAHAAFWTGDYDHALDAARSALVHSQPGSRSDCRALGHAIAAGVFRQGTAGLEEHLDRLLATDPVLDAWGVIAQAINSAMMALVSEAPRPRVEQCRDRLEELYRKSDDRDPIARAWVEYVRGMFARNVDNDPWTALEHDRASMEHFELGGDRAFVPYAGTFVGADLGLLGMYDQALVELSRAREKARPQSVQANLAEYFRTLVLLDKGDLQDAREEALEVANKAKVRGDKLVLFLASMVQAESFFHEENLNAAHTATLALEGTLRLPYQTIWLHTLRAQIQLAIGEPAAALQSTEDAMVLVQRLERGYFARHATLLSTCAEALLALGKTDLAVAATRAAHEHVLTRAARISDENVRRCFLNMKTHVRINKLAQSLPSAPVHPTP